MIKILLISLVVWVVMTILAKATINSMNLSESFKASLCKDYPKRVNRMVVLWIISSIECVVCLILFIVML